MKISARVFFLLMPPLLLGGCYETHWLPKYQYPNNVWIVNYTGDDFDLLDIGNSSMPGEKRIFYSTVPTGASIKILLTVSNEVMITRPSACKNMVTSYGLDSEEYKSLKTACQATFLYSKEDLYAAAESLLSEHYRTCLFLHQDGTLEAKTEYDTPWEGGSKYDTPCSEPGARKPITTY